MRQIFAVGIGGSGAKCLESVLFLHALGIFGDSKLGLLLVDADAANGNSQRAQTNLRKTINGFQSFRKGSSPFMSGEFEDYGLWNPLAEVVHSSDLERIFNKQSLSASHPRLAKLMNALYSPKEQRADLGVGFRGRPPIGSAIMSRLELSNLQSSQEGSWQRLFGDLQIACGNGDEVSIHFFGSVFGGTGASGVPTLVTLIDRHLRETGYRNKVHLNASTLLPYFGFEKPEDGEQQVFAETRFFALNTQAALQFLTENSSQVFDTVYLIGNHEREIYKSHTGGAQQQNNAHFVELYAALAINHGFQQPTQQTQAAYISRRTEDGIGWGDIPDRAIVQPLLAKGVRFAYAWRYNFALELEAARSLGAKQFVKGAPWFAKYFSLTSNNPKLPSVSDEEQKRQNGVLNDWTKSFLLWAQQIANSNRKGASLFQLSGLDTSQDLPSYQEDLSEVVIDGNKSPADKRRDNIDTLKNQLADQGEPKAVGVFGLAHSLFELL